MAKKQNPFGLAGNTPFTAAWFGKNAKSSSPPKSSIDGKKALQQTINRFKASRAERAAKAKKPTNTSHAKNVQPPNNKANPGGGMVHVNAYDRKPPRSK